MYVHGDLGTTGNNIPDNMTHSCTLHSDDILGLEEQNQLHQLHTTSSTRIFKQTFHFHFCDTIIFLFKNHFGKIVYPVALFLILTLFNIKKILRLKDTTYNG